MRKIVNFEMCTTCKHYELPEFEEPCHDCLNEQDREDNSAPVFYEPVKGSENSQIKPSV